MRLILMGPPGSGKGTQAEFIADKLNVPHISTGDMFRKAIGEQTELGRKAKEYLDSGRLVPDEVTVGIVKERLKQPDCKQGFLLDGFPRTVAQAEALDRILNALDTSIDAVINIEVSREELIKRLTGRRMCRECGASFHLAFNPPKVDGVCDKCKGELYQRKDDSEETINSRLEVYQRQTEPLIGYYREQGLLKNINGSQEIRDVLSDIGRAIGRDW